MSEGIIQSESGGICIAATEAQTRHEEAQEAVQAAEAGIVEIDGKIFKLNERIQSTEHLVRCGCSIFQCLCQLISGERQTCLSSYPVTA